MSGGFHHAPGLVPALADDQVQHVGFQAVLEDLTDGRTQVLQNQVSHIGTDGAVTQLSLSQRELQKSRMALKLTGVPWGTLWSKTLTDCLTKDQIKVD